MAEPRKVNPTMLVIGRESRGHTQTAFSQMAGVAQGTISKAENGQLELTDELLRRYSDVLKYPVEFFFQDIWYTNIPATFHRKRQRVSQSITKAVQAKLNILRLQLRKLIAALDPPEMRVPTVDLRSARHTPETIARQLRMRWHVPSGPIASMTKLIEDAGVLVIRVNFGTDEIDGVSFYEPADQIPPIILINPDLPGDRQRHTLAHELAHLIFHQHLPLAPMDCESQADRFAAEFLLPTAEITGFLTRLNIDKLTNLKSYWKVSIGTLIRRAVEVEQITPSMASKLYMKMTQYGYSRVNEPAQISPEEPQLIRQLVNFHLDTLKYDEDGLGRLLGLHAYEVPEYYPIPQKLRVLR